MRWLLVLGAGRPLHREVHVRHLLLHAPALGQGVLHDPVLHRARPRGRDDVGAPEALRGGRKQAAPGGDADPPAIGRQGRLSRPPGRPSGPNDDRLAALAQRAVPDRRPHPRGLALRDPGRAPPGEARPGAGPTRARRRVAVLRARSPSSTWPSARRSTRSASASCSRRTWRSTSSSCTRCRSSSCSGTPSWMADPVLSRPGLRAPLRMLLSPLRLRGPLDGGHQRLARAVPLRVDPPGQAGPRRRAPHVPRGVAPLLVAAREPLARPFPPRATGCGCSTSSGPRSR